MNYSRKTYFILSKNEHLVKVRFCQYNNFEAKMSKKNKSKFHKRIKAQILQGISQEQKTQKPVISKQTTAPVVNTTKNLPTAPIATTTTLEDEVLINTKKDLKKSAIIIGSIIILIIGLSIVNNKTNILLKAGNQLFRVLNTQS